MVLACEEPILNADPAEQMRLLDLQEIDTSLDRLRHRRANLPEQARVEELSTKARVLADRVTALEVEVADVALEQRKADQDVELVRDRAVKDANLLDSGTISDPKQLTHLQSEIASLARRQSELEDVEIEIMERLEQAEHRLRDLLIDKEQLDTELAQAQTMRDAALAELASGEADLLADRERVAATIEASVREFYDRLRGEYAGVGAARLFRGRCEGCRIELTPVDISRIREAPENEILRCEECRRILIRTPESGL